MARRSLILFAIVNTALAIPHLIPPQQDYFRGQRLAHTISRSFHGLLEFVAFVLGSFSGPAARALMFLILVLLPVVALWLLIRAWHAGYEERLVSSFAVLLNAAFGLATAWAGSLPVLPAVTCHGSFQGADFQVVSYREMGWLPGANHFLALPSPRGMTQVAYARTRQLVPNPCDAVPLLFPDFEMESMLPNNSLEPTRDRRAKMEAGPADVPTTRSRGRVAGYRPIA